MPPPYRASLAVCIVAFLVGSDPARAEEPDPRFGPNLHAAAAKTSTRDVYFNGWLGAAYYPAPAAVSGYIAVGPEIDVRTGPQFGSDGAAVIFGPTLRTGIAVLGDEKNIVSFVSMYTITGFRMPSPVNGGATRLGVGVSAPLLSYALRFALPTLLEGTVDLSESGPEWSFHVGYGFL